MCSRKATVYVRCLKEFQRIHDILESITMFCSLIHDVLINLKLLHKLITFTFDWLTYFFLNSINDTCLFEYYTKQYNIHDTDYGS